MTTNEKIQHYRKKLGLSQEELGQKLLVSRQTVSLWENGQTAPTIDNLIRLKEIFGVSVDELLGYENETDKEATEEAENEKTLESYKFTLSKDDISATYKALFKKIYMPLIILIILMSIIFLLIVSIDIPDVVTGIFYGLMTACIFSFVCSILIFRKSWKTQQQKLETTNFNYKVFDDYFISEEISSGGFGTTEKVFFSQVDKVLSTDNLLLVMIKSKINTLQIYILKKSDLINNSAFYMTMYNKPVNDEEKEKTKKLMIAANIFFVLSLIIAVAVTAIKYVNIQFSPKPWLFILPLPIPIICTALGFALKKKGCKYKKQIVAGIISVLLLYSSGSFYYWISDYSHDPITTLTYSFGIDMPIQNEKDVISYNYENQPTETGFVYYHTKVKFDEVSADDFERNVIYDNRWLTNIPDELNKALAPIKYDTGHNGADRIMLYSETEGKFNIPLQENKYNSYIAVFYFSDENRAEIFEYEYDLSPAEDE